MDKFKTISPSQYCSVFDDIGKDWMLITAGNKDKTNAMTASWGGLGVMWGKNVAYIVVRPQRFTKTLIDTQSTFSLCWLGQEHRKTLGYMGKASGYKEDKIATSGLTVVHHTDGTPYFAQATKVLVCTKLFAQPYTADSFVDKSILSQWYPDHDLHTLYIGNIDTVLTKV